MPETLRNSKNSPYEEAVHIPFILRYPGKVKGNLRTQTLFSSVDVFPTLMGLCGLDSPCEVQGKDLSHGLLGNAGEERDSVYLQVLGPGWPTLKKSVGLWRGVRTDRYTYVRTLDGPWLLYDNETDPYQMENLVGRPEHDEIQQDLEGELQKRLDETNDDFLPGMEYIERWGYPVNENGTVPYTG